MVLTLVLATLCAVALSILFSYALEDMFDVPALQRTNYRGATLVTANGVIVVGAVLLAWVLFMVTDPDVIPVYTAFRNVLPLILVLGFGFLGFLDDVVGAGQSGGFRGHLGALRKGHLSSGALKLFGGGALAFGVSCAVSNSWVPRVLLTLAISLSANTLNLFDRAPLRVTKVALFWWLLALTAMAFTDVPAGVGYGAVAVGALLGLMLGEAHERSMMGDVGANAVGALLGFLTFAQRSNLVLLVGVLVLLALNVMSEKISFSHIIANNRVLRSIDLLGAHARKEWIIAQKGHESQR